MPINKFKSAILIFIISITTITEIKAQEQIDETIIPNLPSNPVQE